MPLEMQMRGPAEVSFAFHFELDAPIDAGIFSTEVPAGYAPAAEDSGDSGS